MENSEILHLIIRVSHSGGVALEHHFSGTAAQLERNARRLAARHRAAVCDAEGNLLPQARIEFIWPDSPADNKTFEPGDFEQDVMPPLKPDHPAVGMECGVCDERFVADDVTMLIPKERPKPGETLVEMVLCHERCVRENSLPTHCEQCGCLLQGGATQHTPECPWARLIEESLATLQ